MHGRHSAQIDVLGLDTPFSEHIDESPSPYTAPLNFGEDSYVIEPPGETPARAGLSWLEDVQFAETAAAEASAAEWLEAEWLETPAHAGEETPEAIPALRRVEGLSGVEPGALQFPLRIPAGVKAVLLLDQKKLTTAFPVLTVKDGRGATLKLRYSEGLFDTKPPKLKGNRDVVEGKVSRGFADTYTADGARRVYRTLFWRTFRYLQLEIETGDLSIDRY